MKRASLILFLFIVYGFNVKSCNLDVDSLFLHNISKLEKYFESIMNGEVMAIGNISNPIPNIYIGKPTKCNNPDLKLFIHNKDHVRFLRMFEDITGYNWERDTYVPNILISQQEVFMIRDWYEENKLRINHEKVEKLFLWYENSNRDLYDREATESYYKLREEYKVLKTLVD